MATKINHTTGNRALDEDIRRLYALSDSLTKQINAIKPSTATSSVTTTQIIPTGSSNSPNAATTVTQISETSAVGSLLSYAREDHIHNGPCLLYADASVPSGNTIANTTTATAFASSYTIPANTLAADMVLELDLCGNYGLYTPLAGTITITVKIGSTQVLSFGPFTLAGAFSANGWGLDAVMFVTSIGASGTIEVQGRAEFATLGTTGVDVSANTSPFTIDTTTNQAITVTWQFSVANAGNTTQLRTMMVRVDQ